jgi:hypothetical protein
LKRQGKLRPLQPYLPFLALVAGPATGSGFSLVAYLAGSDLTPEGSLFSQSLVAQLLHPSRTSFRFRTSCKISIGGEQSTLERWKSAGRAGVLARHHPDLVRGAHPTSFSMVRGVRRNKDDWLPGRNLGTRQKCGTAAPGCSFEARAPAPHLYLPYHLPEA